MSHSRWRFNARGRPGRLSAPARGRPAPSSNCRRPRAYPFAEIRVFDTFPVAYRLLSPAGMDTGLNQHWRPLTAETISALPQAGAVFEVANLVRTIHYIGAAGGNLRARLVTFAQEQVKHLPSPGGYYIRYEQASSEDEALAKRLASYRAKHGGLLPLGNRDTTPTLRVAPRHAA